MDRGDSKLEHSMHSAARNETAMATQEKHHAGFEVVNTELQQDEPKPSLRTWLAIAAIIYTYCISLGVFMMLCPIITIINAELGPDPSYTWMASAWTVSAGIGLIAAGSLSDVLGRRWFVVATGGMAILSAIVGLTAKSVPQMIGAMALLGLNQAGALTSFASVSELVPNKWRGAALGIMNFAAFGFVSCGSLIGHEMAEDTGPGWRSIFWLTLATNIVAVIACALTYYPAEPLASKGVTKMEIIRNFDYIGLLGIICGPLLFLLGITWIPQYGSTSGRFLGPFISGCVVMIALGIYETFWAKNPLLHPFLFSRVRTFTLILVVAFVGGMLFYCLVAFWPTFLQAVFDGEDARQLGVDGIPFGVGTQVGGVGSALLLPFLGPIIGTQWMLFIGVLLQLLFIPLMHLVGIHGKAMALAFSFLGGAGIGVAELLAIILIQMSTPDEWIGFATGALGLLRSMGGSAGTAIYSSILQSKMKELIPANVGAAALKAGLPPSSLPLLIEILTGVDTKTAITAVPGVTPDITVAATLALKEGYIDSFRYIWLSSIAFGVIALACAAATKDLSSTLTMHTAQHLKNEPFAQKDEKKNVEYAEQA